MPMPASYPTFPYRLQFVQYLSDYVSLFGIHPAYGRSVESASFDEGTEKWEVKLGVVVNGEFEEYSGRFLVVASGETSDAFVPEVEGLSSFQGEILHSTQYKCGKEYTGKNVLVVVWEFRHGDCLRARKLWGHNLHYCSQPRSYSFEGDYAGGVISSKISSA